MVLSCCGSNGIFFVYRVCNCDAADDQFRSDAGTFGSMGDKNLLPIMIFMYKNPGLSGAYGHVKLGPLYCSEVAFGKGFTVFLDVLHQHLHLVVSFAASA